MNEPLTKTQRELRGHAVGDMSLEQLRDWIEACTKMERWVGVKKARRSWGRSCELASAELIRRGVQLPNLIAEDTNNGC